MADPINPIGPDDPRQTNNQNLVNEINKVNEALQRQQELLRQIAKTQDDVTSVTERAIKSQNELAESLKRTQKAATEAGAAREAAAKAGGVGATELNIEKALRGGRQEAEKLGQVLAMAIEKMAEMAGAGGKLNTTIRVVSEAGKITATMRQQAALQTPMLSRWEKIKEATKKIGDTLKAAANEVRAMGSAAGGLFSMILGGVESASTVAFDTFVKSAKLAFGEIGVLFTPVIVKLSGMLQGVATWFKNLSPAAKESLTTFATWTGYILASAAALGAVVKVASMLAVVFGPLVKGVMLLGPGLKVAYVWLAAMLGPAGALVIALTAAGLAAYGLYKWFNASNASAEKVKKQWDDIGDAAKRAERGEALGAGHAADVLTAGGFGPILEQIFARHGAAGIRRAMSTLEAAQTPEGAQTRGMPSEELTRRIQQREQRVASTSLFSRAGIANLLGAGPIPEEKAILETDKAALAGRAVRAAAGEFKQGPDTKQQALMTEIARSTKGTERGIKLAAPRGAEPRFMSFSDFGRMMQLEFAKGDELDRELADLQRRGNEAAISTAQSTRTLVRLAGEAPQHPNLP